MGTAMAEQDLHVLPPSDPFDLPYRDVCFINGLPPELLSRVFEVGSVVDSDSEEEDDTTVDHQDNSSDETDEDGDSESSDLPQLPYLIQRDSFPVVVSHVCHRWRDIAFSTPTIWTTILVPPLARPPYMLQSSQLERSKSLPIDIYINGQLYKHGLVGPSDADLRFLFAMFTAHIRRWRTVQVSVSDYHHMNEFFSAVSDPSIVAAPQLTVIELYYDGGSNEYHGLGYLSLSRRLTLFGGSAPLLTRLVLWRVHINWNQPWITSAPNLKDLELAFHLDDVRPSWTQFSTILRGAPALEKLDLRFSGPSGDPTEWFIEPSPGNPANLNAPIQLSRVTNFVLAYQSQACAIGFLQKFHLPALKNLILDFDIGDYTEFIQVLAGPATSPSPPSAQEQSQSLLSRLESLKIAELCCSIQSIESLYGELQCLSSLNISLSHLPALFLDILGTPCTLVGRGDVWLPRLVTLYVSGASGSALREMVQKRMDAGVPLGSLYVEKEFRVFEKDVEWLKENVKTFEFLDGF